MFDWFDQEIANIIWDEADDQIVPYPEDSEKKLLQAFADPDNNELTVAATNTKKSDLEKVLEISEDQHEDGDLGEIVGNSWANIGSFDDLDQILNDNDLVGHASLDSTDELGLSSQDMISGMTKSSSALDSTSWRLEPLDNSSSPFTFSTGCLHDENQSFASGYGKVAYPTSFTQHSSVDHDKMALGSAEKNGTGSHFFSGKIGSTETVNKGNQYRSQRKQELGSEKISDRRLLEDVYGAWPPPSLHLQHFDTHSLQVPAISYPSPVIGQQNIPHQSLSYEQFSNPYASSYGYGNIQDQYNTSGPVRSSIQAGSSEMGSIKKLKDTLTKPMKMTPQEKIEKLRRRRQMRAMLAIRKQQQQLTHSVSVADYPIAQKSSMEDQTQNLERTDVGAEDNMKTPRYNPISPLKQDESGPISGEVDDHNVEDRVLYQLQDSVAKLDMKICLCIKDSLSRLAQSTMQRHHASDSSSGSRSEIYEHNVMKEDMSNHDRVVKIPSTETETNHVDRAVAHLLFHRPFKPSRKHVGTPESFTSTKIPPELETGVSTNLSVGSLVKNSENEQGITPCGSIASPLFMEPRQELSEHMLQADMSMDQEME